MGAPLMRFGKRQAKVPVDAEQSANQKTRKQQILTNVYRAIGAVAGLATIVVAVYTIDGPGSNAAKPTRHLESVGLIVYNRNGLSGPGPGSKQPDVEVLLHNTGNSLSVVRALLVKVRGVAQLTRCFSAGAIPLSGTYDVTLPETPKLNETVEAPLHEELAADQPDRFRLSIGTPGQSTLSNIDLLQLELSLLHDSSTVPVKLGTVLIAAPLVPAEQGYFLSKAMGLPGHGTVFGEINSHTGRTFYTEVAPCWRANELKLKQMLALAGQRSGELATVGSELVLPMGAG